jgi:3-oxoacyl-[acyl-carrier protein] reductase
MVMDEPTAFDAAARFDVRGRRALVTGAAHGLGLATATAFAGAGASVALLDRDEPGLDTSAKLLEGNGRVVTLPCDVTDDGEVDRAVERARAELGGLDVLVNCAAVYPTEPVSEMSSDALAGVLDVNLAGYARLVRAARPSLAASGRGRVVNFSSITFFLGFPDGLGAYIASKGAVVGYTRALARELGPNAVTVNAIAPGAFPTRAEEIIEDRDSYEVTILERQALKRRGDVADIACAVLFLASDAASFVTGQVLVVDGGWVFA